METGASAAQALADDGADVIVTYRANEDEANSVVAELSGRHRKASALWLDITDHESFPDFAGKLREWLREQWRREDFDILVNDAETARGGTAACGEGGTPASSRPGRVSPRDR